jgi:hypothetical protein
MLLVHRHHHFNNGKNKRPLSSKLMPQIPTHNDRQLHLHNSSIHIQDIAAEFPIIRRSTLHPSDFSGFPGIAP